MKNQKKQILPIEIEYKQNTVSFNEFERFYKQMDTQFVPALSSYLDISAYITKMYHNAELFEALGSERHLIGCVVCYANDDINKNSFITSVIVHPDFRGQHIAESLLKNCFSFLQENGFKNVGLEVNKFNLPAQRLYKKLGFSFSGENGNSYTMSKNIVIKI